MNIRNKRILKLYSSFIPLSTNISIHIFISTVDDDFEFDCKSFYVNGSYLYQNDKFQNRS